MLFNSINFLVFFFCFFLIYFKSNLKFQNILLLLGGIFFYAFWNIWASLILILSILINYFMGNLLFSKKNYKKRILFFGIIGNLSLLFFFKYAIFVSNILNDFFLITNINFKFKILNIILPIGISFYTFHNISYLVDLYKEKILPSKNLISFSVYDLFFPLLLAGPIERAEKLIPQIEAKRKINKDKVVSGTILFCIGILKKVFISDNLSELVDLSLKTNSMIPEGFTYTIAFLFAFQVYTDFSGYTDSARGLARILGFELSLNFNLPFVSKNPSEFWTRWHISLSTWLRDYVYIPLGGNKYGFIKQNTNLLIVWILGGLWHGATYGYLIWGGYCGIQVVGYNLIQKLNLKITISNFFDKYFLNNIYRILTFFLFGFGLLLFRVENYTHLERLVINSKTIFFNLNLNIKILFFISPVLILESISIYKNDLEAFHPRKINSFLFYTITFVFSLQFILFSSFQLKEFFYFQF